MIRVLVTLLAVIFASCRDNNQLLPPPVAKADTNKYISTLSKAEIIRKNVDGSMVLNIWPKWWYAEPTTKPFRIGHETGQEPDVCLLFIIDNKEYMSICSGQYISKLTVPERDIPYKFLVMPIPPNNVNAIVCVDIYRVWDNNILIYEDELFKTIEDAVKPGARP